MIVNGYLIRRTIEDTIEVVNVSGVKLVCDGVGAKRRALEWTRNRVQGSMNAAEVEKLEQIEDCYDERCED